MKIEHTFTLGNQQITLETNRIAKQADASVVVYCGETMVMANICAAKTQKPDIDFFPLTVNYQEKYYASGKIPGGFFKREARPTERETLISRLIDRPIRPLFHKNFKNETQVTLTVLSYDGTVDPDVIAMYATGAALAISGLPVAGTLGAARVGYIDGQLVANPTIQEMENSELDLILAGTEEGVLMVESEAQELPESTMLDAVNFGHEFYQNFIKEVHTFAGKTEIKTFEAPSLPDFYEGLQKSINTVTARVMKRLGPNSADIVKQTASKMGIDDSKFEPYPSICLGTMDISVFEMVSAYGTFVNEGTWVEPIFITKIEDKNGDEKRTSSRSSWSRLGSILGRLGCRLGVKIVLSPSVALVFLKIDFLEKMRVQEAT